MCLMLYQVHLHSNRRLTAKHTFLDQICLPDSLLDRPFSHLILHIDIRASPSHIDMNKQYLNTANGLSVSYTLKQQVGIQTWFQVYERGMHSFDNYVIQNSTWAKVIPERGAECIDIRYLASPLSDESVVKVTAEYKIQAYWVL